MKVQERIAEWRKYGERHPHQIEMVNRVIAKIEAELKKEESK